MEKADSLLAPLLRRLGLEDDVRLVRIKTAWPTIFSEPLCSHMLPSKLSGGELLLNVDSPLWIQQLSFSRKEILQKLSAFGVREIRFRIGSLARKSQEPLQVKKAALLSAEDAAFLEELVSGMADEALQEAIRSAAEKHLRSTKKQA